MKRKNEKKRANRKWNYFLFGILGLLVMLQTKVASADLIGFSGIEYSSAPGAPWMETAVIIIVGLMVIMAVWAILFLHHQKKQDAQERMQREEAEREEQ